MKKAKDKPSYQINIQKSKTTKPRFEISSIIDEFKSVNQDLIINDGYKDVIGTANPYQFNLFSDLITNPSSVSIDEYQKMVYTQPIISNALTTLTNLIINKIGTWVHKNKKYEEFIHTMFDNMERPIRDIYKDILTALWAGFSVGEKLESYNGRYKVVLDVEPRPAQSFIFRVDSQGHLKDDGIIQYYFNNLWTGYGNLLAFNQMLPNGELKPNPYASRGDFSYPWRTVWAQPIGTIMIPKQKCVHYAYKGLDGLTSPYGRSLLRSVYDYYLLSTELNRIILNASNTASTPIPVVVVEPNQTNMDDGTNPLDDIALQLENISNPGGANYLLMQGKLNESVFIDKLNTQVHLNDILLVKKYIDKLVLTGMLGTGDLTGLNEGGSYARSETQHNILNRNVTSIAENIQDVIIKQLIKPLLKTNFDERLDYGSYIVKNDMNEDVKLNMDKLNSLYSQGIKLKPEAIMNMLNLTDDMIAKLNLNIENPLKKAIE